MTCLISACRLLAYWWIRYLANGADAARFLGVKVGRGCRIYTRNFGTEPWLIKIGDRVTVTAGVVFLTHDGSLWLIRDENGRRHRYAPIEIGDDVFVGINSILLPGVRIGNRVIIAAGSVVTKSIPDGVVVAGNPARIIKQYDEFKRLALIHYPSDRDLVGGSFRARVAKVCERQFRPGLRP